MTVLGGNGGRSCLPRCTKAAKTPLNTRLGAPKQGRLRGCRGVRDWLREWRHTTGAVSSSGTTSHEAESDPDAGEKKRKMMKCDVDWENWFRSWWLWWNLSEIETKENLEESVFLFAKRAISYKLFLCGTSYTNYLLDLAHIKHKVF